MIDWLINWLSTRAWCGLPASADGHYAMGFFHFKVPYSSLNNVNFSPKTRDVFITILPSSCDKYSSSASPTQIVFFSYNLSITHLKQFLRFKTLSSRDVTSLPLCNLNYIMVKNTDHALVHELSRLLHTALHRRRSVYTSVSHQLARSISMSVTWTNFLLMLRSSSLCQYVEYVVIFGVDTY